MNEVLEKIDESMYFIKNFVWNEIKKKLFVIYDYEIYSFVDKFLKTIREKIIEHSKEHLMNSMITYISKEYLGCILYKFTSQKTYPFKGL